MLEQSDTSICNSFVCLYQQSTVWRASFRSPCTSKHMSRNVTSSTAAAAIVTYATWRPFRLNIPKMTGRQPFSYAVFVVHVPVVDLQQDCGNHCQSNAPRWPQHLSYDQMWLKCVCFFLSFISIMYVNKQSTCITVVWVWSQNGISSSRSVHLSSTLSATSVCTSSNTIRTK